MQQLYCGPAPEPHTLIAAWNGDAIAISLCALLALAFLRRGEPGGERGVHEGHGSGLPRAAGAGTGPDGTHTARPRILTASRRAWSPPVGKPPADGPQDAAVGAPGSGSKR